jgi:hypothetical protein
MSAQQDVYALLTAILPVLGIMLPGIIKNDGQSAEKNAIITFVILLLAGGGQAWSTNRLTGLNPWLDFMAVEAAMSSLLGGPLKPIDAFIQANIGLISAKPAAQPQAQMKYATRPLPSAETTSQPPK